MTKPPLHVVMSRMARFPLAKKAVHLEALIRNEPPRSVRRDELIGALKAIRLRQLRQERRLSA